MVFDRTSLFVFVLLLNATPLFALRITEIMYHPSDAQGDLEYVELFNDESTALDLSGYHFCDGIDYAFPDMFLEPGAYLVVAANATAVQQAYSIVNVVGDWGGTGGSSLSNGGEAIEICDNAGVVRARVEYNDVGKWPAGADGAGHSLAIDAAFAPQSDTDRWFLSGELGGSPGVANDVSLGAMPVSLNELHTRVAEGEARWLEIYNGGDAEIDLSGYHVSTDRDNLQMASLPAGTMLPPRGWLRLDEAQLGLSLEMPAPDEKFLVILSMPGGARVVDAVNFRPTLVAHSEARVPDGSRILSRAAQPTPESANLTDVTSSVIINEIHYHPIDDDEMKEFVEIYNRGGEPVDLSGWALTEGVRFDFPAIVLSPGEYLVVTPNPEGLRQTYELAAERVVGPATEESRQRFGRLSNDGERVTLRDAKRNIADTVAYRDGGEWSHWADGGGSSLERIDPRQDGESGQAWDASDDSARAPITEIDYFGTSTTSEGELHLVLPGRGKTLVDEISLVTPLTIFVEEQPFATFDGEWKYFRATEAPPADWQLPSFDDATWLDGHGTIGYGRDDEDVVLEDMQNNFVAVYFRRRFVVGDPNQIQGLNLKVDFDDGYAAYLNGTEIARTQLATDATWEVGATRSARAGFIDDVDASEFASALVQGENVLAIEVHNLRASSNDFRFSASFASGEFVVDDTINSLVDGDFESEESTSFWRIQGTHVYSGRVTDGAISGSGSLSVISTGNGDNKVNRIETMNEGIVPLIFGAEYHVTLKARWQVGVPTLLTHGQYQSSRVPPFAASHPLALPDRFGTPGAVNFVTERQIAQTGSANIGPVISNVRHSPAVPGDGEPVRVEAYVQDADGVESVTLVYSLNDPLPDGDTGQVSVVMQSVGDGRFVAEIPGQPLNTRVVFFVTARDSVGARGRFPLDHLARTHPMRARPDLSPPADDLYAIYAHAAPKTEAVFHSYRAYTHDSAQATLSSRALHSNDLIDATFIFNDRDVYYNSKIRFSGSPFARGAWGSFRIRMPDDRPLHGEIKKFGLESHQGDGGRDARERISHYLIRFNQGTTQVPYSRLWLTDLRVNQRVNGFRTHYANPNREFLEKWFPGDQNGPFFEVDDRFTISDSGARTDSNDARLLYPPYGPASLGGDKEMYRYFLNSRGGNPFDEWDDVIELARILSPRETPAEIFDEVIWDVIDVEEFLRIWSVRLNTDDWDTWGARRGKNCYLYKPTQGRWVLLAWDMELTYADSGSFRPPVISGGRNSTYSLGFTEVTRLINRPQIKRRYYGILNEMLEGPFNSEFLTPYMEKLDEAGMSSSSTRHGKPSGFVDSRGRLLLRAVAGALLSEIGFRVTTNAGMPFVSEIPQIMLTGVAGVEVRDIAVSVDGVQSTSWQTRFSGDDMFVWLAGGELDPGAHRIDFVGFDSSQNPVAQTSIEVTVGEPTERFLRGDADSSGDLDISDPIRILLHLFASFDVGCRDAADVSDDGIVDQADAIALLMYLFEPGPPPAAPFPEVGTDPTPDSLTCFVGL